MITERHPDSDLWSLYYHRVLAATLVALTCAAESLEERSSLVDLCSKSSEIFRRMRCGCPEKGVALIDTALSRLTLVETGGSAETPGLAARSELLRD